MSSIRSIGSVKWFNNKSGFGFITSSDGEHAGKDIFVHYSSIRAESSQYKYLVQGEYVEFDLVKSENENNEYHASDISGIKGGKLMCEVRRTAVPQDGEQRARPVQRRYGSDRQQEQSDDAGFQKVQRRKPVPRRKPVSDESC